MENVMNIKKCFLSLLILMIVSGSACHARKALSLKPVHQDYFQSVKYRATDDGYKLASVWLTPPAATPQKQKGYIPFMPGAEKTKFINTFSLLSPVILTENYLGAGSTLSIKADGMASSLSFVVDENMLATIGYYDFNVKSRGPAVDKVVPFKATSVSLRRKMILPLANMNGEVEYMAINNSLDTIHYAALTTTRRLLPGMSTTLGAGYITSETGDSDAGIIAGARYEVSPSISLFANFNGADPMKHMYNNHLLTMADQSIGAISCDDCATESFNAGALLKLGTNMALNIYGFDISDLSGTAGSLMYIVKD